MKNLKLALLCALTPVVMAFAATSVQAAGFQRAVAADAAGQPLPIGIWYPSQATPQPLSIGPTTMSVALDAPLAGRGLPLVVISHGTGGSMLGHYDTAIALADAGYVVAAVTHTGDNYADQSRSVFIMDRTRQRFCPGDGFASTLKLGRPLVFERSGDLEADIAGLTAAIFREFEAQIRQSPEHWFYLQEIGDLLADRLVSGAGDGREWLETLAASTRHFSALLPDWPAILREIKTMQSSGPCPDAIHAIPREA